jgi:hypothetical protein
MVRDFAPLLKDAASVLGAALLPSKVSMFSGPVGSATSYQGFRFGIEGLLAGVVGDQPDNLALTLDLCHLDRAPRLAAGVCWGHPSGHIESSLSAQDGSSEQWPLASEARIEELRRELPRLLEAFEQAARRGHP